MKKTGKLVILLVLIAVLSGSLIYMNREKPVTEKESVAETVHETEEGKTDEERDLTKEHVEDKAGEEDEDELIPPPEDTSPPIQVNPEPEEEPYTDFEAYNNMSEEEQQAYYDSFGSPEVFFEWYNQAKAEYENSRNDILLDGSTNVDFGG